MDGVTDRSAQTLLTRLHLLYIRANTIATTPLLRTRYAAVDMHQADSDDCWYSIFRNVTTVMTKSTMYLGE